MRRIGLALLVGVTVATTVVPSAAAAGRVTRAGENAMCNGVPATITAVPGEMTVGTPGNDVIVGTPGADRIDGRGGNDLICGLGGDDIILGGGGNDIIFGGGGGDTVSGGTGRDRLMGGGGDDVLVGGGGIDVLRGDGGVDHCDTGGGRAMSCESGPGVTSPGPNTPVEDTDGGGADPAPTGDPVVPVLPDGLDIRVVGGCVRVDSPSYPGENPWYSGASFCTIELTSTQVAPTLPGTDENVTVGFLCNALNESIVDLKNPMACLQSRDAGAGGVSGIRHLGPRDRPGAVSGRLDYVRTGESYCAHAGSVVYFNSGRSWIANEDVTGTACFTLTAAGRIVWS